MILTSVVMTFISLINSGGATFISVTGGDGGGGSDGGISFYENHVEYKYCREERETGWERGEGGGCILFMFFLIVVIKIN